MTLSVKSCLTVLAGLALSFGCSSTQTANKAPDAAPVFADRGAATAVSIDDKDFVVRAAQGGMAEVELGNLAQQQGASAQVKDYGKRLVADHTRLNNDLREVATKAGIALPSEVNSEQRNDIERLSKFAGAQFDREFLKDSVKDHRGDIAEFEKEATTSQDQALKNFASGSLPTLRDHLEMAEMRKR